MFFQFLTLNGIFKKQNDMKDLEKSVIFRALISKIGYLNFKLDLSQIATRVNPMTHFPDPLTLPDSVHCERKARQRDIVRSARTCLLIRLFIIALELVGAAIFDSAAILLDAFASLIDVAFSLGLVFCIKIAAKPPDDNHPFGHGRIEPLFGLIMGMMQALMGGVLMVQQAFEFSLVPSGGTLDPRAWMFPVAALVLLEICYHILMRAAQKRHSSALAADAMHYRVDAVTSLFAAIALLLGLYFPNWSLTFDHSGAMMIAALMTGLGAYAAWNNSHQLMDRIPPSVFFNRVKTAALKVPGVRDTEKIRIQLYGPDAHVDIDVEVDPDLSVEIAHKISQEVRVEIQKEWPAVQDVVVHIEPYYPNDH